ncbi:hypothetical protein C2G38_2212051 [Gigaspora rosea]|uniref:Uncharacterized protein n=1 Tax=Gigaspora rosea TaxID=44941 RepID=A0A397UMA8_9GLOM|nr:hypothetical protein C2G38_2212051 [Gigaspora rosea]
MKIEAFVFGAGSVVPVLLVISSFCLSGPSFLKILNLERNNIGLEEGLADALCKNSTLTVLSFS